MTDAATFDLIRSAVETLAIVGGGLWAVWTFHKLQSVRAAEAKIANSQRDADKSATETRESERRLLSQQPDLDVAFSEIAEHLWPEIEDRGFFLTVAISLRNRGTRNLAVDFDQAAFTVARYDLTCKSLDHMLDVYRTGAHILGERGNELLDVPYRILRVGQERQMAFLAPIPHAGLYLVQFRALYYMIPFDNEESDGAQPVPIQAVQQRVLSMKFG
jgi:hypothetical protein